MASPVVISDQFLLWSQSQLLWTIAAYAVVADPLHGEASRFRWTRWAILLGLRVSLSIAIAYGLCRSLSLAALLLLIMLAQPFLRYCLPMRWLAEFEVCWVFVCLFSSLAVIRGFHLATYWMPSSISPPQASALCILAAVLLFVVRGGTYIVRGILRKSGTLPSKDQVEAVPKPSSPLLAQPAAGVPVPVAMEIAAFADDSSSKEVDVEEYNRGRLIGNLERIVLTIVVAAGSYAALAFLVAAKSVVRSDEFEKSRNFTEYFLIGSLASVLVALSAGMVLRFALIRLWPDLLTLQIQ